jgi:hypothetical protein
MFEMQSSLPSVETSKPKQEGYRDVWDRVSEGALQILQKDRSLENNPDLLARVEDILNDVVFKNKVKQIWTEQSMKKNGVVNDPKKQDELWASGLAIRIKDMIDN